MGQKRVGWSLRAVTGDLIPQGLGPLRTRILETAIKYLGVAESPPGSNRGPRIEAWWPEWVKIKYRDVREPGPEWCAIYTSHVLKEALGEMPKGLRFRLSSLAMRDDAEQAAIWKPKESEMPVPGDAFVMDKGGNKGHIGFVLRVDKYADFFETIEGNSGNRVRVGLREIADPTLVGFVHSVTGERTDFYQRGLSGKGSPVAKLSTR